MLSLQPLVHVETYELKRRNKVRNVTLDTNLHSTKNLCIVYK